MSETRGARHAPPFRAALLLPPCWPTWGVLGLMWLLARLPVAGLLATGSALGGLAGRLAGSRRGIVRTNLRLCLGEDGLDARVDAHFAALGRGTFETALAWFAPHARLAPHFRVEGREHLDAALADGRGILLLTGHFTTLEIGARALCTALALPFHAMYRPYSNPVMDWCMHRLRERWSRQSALPRDELRGVVRALRAGHAVWYAPDQTLDPRISVFAPFFGVPAASLTATARLATMGRAQVLPYFPRRDGAGWTIRFLPVLRDFPSGDDVADATRINALIEDGVRLAPAEYFWIHRRFKRRPPGMAKLYP